jgi:opacity protein-like surface antigen
MNGRVFSTLLVGALCFGAGVSPARAGEWAGPYVGGHLGYGFLADDSERLDFDTDLDGAFGDTVRFANGADAFAPGFCAGEARGTNAGAGCSEDDDSVDFGLRAGYDWEVGRLIAGVLGEVSGHNMSDDVTGFTSTPAAYNFKRRLNSIIAFRARVGAPFGRTLVYGTAGVAFADIDRDFTSTNTIISFTPRGAENATGYQVGFGAERRMVGRMSFGAEYLYTSLDDDGFTVRFGPKTAPPTNAFLLVNPAGTDVRRTGDSFDFHSVRITATYRFAAK